MDKQPGPSKNDKGKKSRKSSKKNKKPTKQELKEIFQRLYDNPQHFHAARKYEVIPKGKKARAEFKKGVAAAKEEAERRESQGSRRFSRFRNRVGGQKDSDDYDDDVSRSSSPEEPKSKSPNKPDRTGSFAVGKTAGSKTKAGDSGKNQRDSDSSPRRSQGQNQRQSNSPNPNPRAHFKTSVNSIASVKSGGSGGMNEPNSKRHHHHHHHSRKSPLDGLDKSANGKIPEGLEQLATLDSVYVQQLAEILEVIFDVEMDVMYNVFDSHTKSRVYVAGESPTCCQLFCCGQHRPVYLNVFNAIGKIVMKIESHCTSSLCWFGGHFAGTNMKVLLTSTGETLGKMKQNYNCCQPNFQIFDSSENLVMNITGPSNKAVCGSCTVCLDARFEVWFSGNPNKSHPKGIPVGAIMNYFNEDPEDKDKSKSNSKHHAQHVGHTFGITFPADLSPALKAVLLGAIFCINFTYYDGLSLKECNCTGCRGLIIAIILLFIVVLLSIFLL